MKNNFYKTVAALALIFLSFSLQSFSGIQVEKRHYRKGYYVHICHAPKTHPVYSETSREEAEIKPVKEKEAPSREIQQGEDDSPSRNIAPVSQAPLPNN